jgi:flagellar hook-associated protein 3 FlgL
MLPFIDASGQQFLNAVNNVQSRLDTAQRQLASGLKVSQPSDAPDEVSPILQLQADIQRNQGIQSGINDVKTSVDTGEQTLSSSVTLMDQAISLATQATGTDQTADTRASLAQQVQSLLEEMVANSQTTVAGQYIFSGDNSQTPAYQLDLSSATGVDRLQTVASTNQVQAPGGSTFSASLSANDIFDLSDASGNPVSGNVFASLNGLRMALLANDDTGIQSSISSIQAASQHLNDELAFYGRTQDRISSALDQTQNADVQLRSELSSRQDADATAAIVELTQAQVQLQAAYQARAKIPQQSLFQLM